MTWTHAISALCVAVALIAPAPAAERSAPAARVGTGVGILAISPNGQTDWEIGEFADRVTALE